MRTGVVHGLRRPPAADRLAGRGRHSALLPIVIDMAGWGLARLPAVVDGVAHRFSAAALHATAAGRSALHPALMNHFPDRERAWYDRIHEVHLQRCALGILDFIRALWGTPQAVMRRVSVQHWPQLVAYREQGVPVILLAGHFIGLPIAVRALAERIPLQVVARMFGHPGLRRPLTRLARRTGGGCSDGGRARALYQHLRRGETVLLLADYGMAEDGRRAAIGVVSRLVERTGAGVLPLAYRRQGQ